MSFEELVGDIPDGATVGLGGAGLQRKPMAAARALARAGRRDLTLVSFLGSLDVELLLAAGCVRALHSAGVALDGAGLAPRYRAGRQEQTIEFVEWSEGTLLCAVQATARGVPSLPTWTGLDTDLPQLNPGVREAVDPFTGERVTQVRALALDVAILHVPAVDARGNAYVEGDFAIDGALARAAQRVYVCHERTVNADPRRAVLSRLWVDALVPAPGGAWPTGCHPDYKADLGVVSRWAAEGARGGIELLAEPVR
ncbi:MAG TPA: CoA-transferase [Solirubrobacteraceae bacterium]|nr:CoA-transferase [Solirubrobacteraceae bacterium]